MTSSRVVAVIQSDKHAGHKLGLCNPDTVLPADDEVGRPYPAKPDLSPFQEALWSMYSEDLAGALQFADGDEVIVFDLGDQTHGLRHPDHLMSTRLADQMIIARHNWAPWLGHRNVRTFRFSKGTGVHVFGEGSSELLVAEMMGEGPSGVAHAEMTNDAESRVAERLPRSGLDVRVLYHGLATLGKDDRGQTVGLDYAHHGPGPGMRDWTSGNQVRYYLKSIIDEQRRLGTKPARLYCRGHRHAFVHESLHEFWAGELYDYDIFTLPSYCGMGAYGHKATFSAPYQWFGSVAIEIVDGQVGRFRKLVHCRDLRTWEALYE
jgi:hypothetical protein